MPKRLPIWLVILFVASLLAGCPAPAGTVVLVPGGCSGFPTVDLAEVKETTVMVNQLSGDSCGHLDEISVSYPKYSFDLQATFAGVSEGAARFYTSESPEANIFIATGNIGNILNQEFVVGQKYAASGTGTLRVVWQYDPENAVYFLRYVSIVAVP